MTQLSITADLALHPPHLPPASLLCSHAIQTMQLPFLAEVELNHPWLPPDSIPCSPHSHALQTMQLPFPAEVELNPPHLPPAPLCHSHALQMMQPPFPADVELNHPQLPIVSPPCGHALQMAQQSVLLGLYCQYHRQSIMALLLELQLRAMMTKASFCPPPWPSSKYLTIINSSRGGALGSG
jgi:hypothetical protein